MEESLEREGCLSVSLMFPFSLLSFLFSPLFSSAWSILFHATPPPTFSGGKLKKRLRFSPANKVSFQKQLFLELQGAGESPGDLDERQIRIPSVWGLTSDPLVLVSTQAMLVLMNHRVHEPHLQGQESSHPYVVLLPCLKTW